jgi:hypothetical protein
MKRTIEIDDNLEEIEKDVNDEVRDDFIDWLEDNIGESDFDTYYQSSGCDAVHQAGDSNTPIYNSDIDGLYYLYSDEFEEAYKNAGIGNGSEDNHKQVAICMYLEEKGFDFQRKLEEAFKDWIGEYNDIEGTDAEIEVAQKESLKNFIEQIKEIE